MNNKKNDRINDVEDVLMLFNKKIFLPKMIAANNDDLKRFQLYCIKNKNKAPSSKKGNNTTICQKERTIFFFNFRLIVKLLEIILCVTKNAYFNANGHDSEPFCFLQYICSVCICMI